MGSVARTSYYLSSKAGFIATRFFGESGFSVFRRVVKWCRVLEGLDKLWTSRPHVESETHPVRELLMCGPAERELE